MLTPTDGGNPCNSQTIYCPDKMIRPILLTRIKQGDNFLGLRIDASRKVVAIPVATLAG
jgi:hypothetical protein